MKVINYNSWAYDIEFQFITMNSHQFYYTVY